MHRATVRQLAGIALLGLVAGAAFVLTSPRAVLGHAETLAGSPALLAVVLVVLYLVRPLLAWPISALSFLLGYLFGPIAIPVALAGALVTTFPAYGLARYVGHDVGLLGRVSDAGTLARRTTGDVRGVAAVRLAPLPTDPVSYAIGLAGVPLRPYVVGTVLGEAPWVVATVLLGASASQLAAVGAGDNPLLVVATAALAALLVLSGPAYRRLTRPA